MLGHPAPMPRMPTIIARKARAAPVERAATLPPDTPLPPLAVMGEEYDLHPATIFRHPDLYGKMAWG